MNFRYGTVNDIDVIMMLYQKAKGTEGCTWDENYPSIVDCKADIKDESLLVLEHDGKIIAAISYDQDEGVMQMEVWNSKIGKARELARLVVDEEYRNQGIARKMIIKSMEELKKRGYKAVRFLVSPHNHKAMASYEKLKFTKAGEVDYWGHHWYCYEKSLFKTEKSITSRFSKEIWRPFIEGVEKYKLINNGDKIGVCISGGKDSMLLAKLLQMTKEYGMYDISLEYLLMNPGYTLDNLKKIKWNADVLGVPVTVFETDIFDSTEEIGRNPCFFCSRMRRGHLYRRAKELGCNKIALGHHYDDVIETILMGMLYGAQVQTMLPKLQSDNVANMELIRPMYLIDEAAIEEWKKYNEFDFVKCACRLAQKDEAEDTTRLKVKKIIKELSNENPVVRANIFASVQNVDLKKIISYKEESLK